MGTGPAEEQANFERPHGGRRLPVDAARLVSDLCEVLGDKLVAYLAAAENTATVRQWADGGKLPMEAELRLRVAHRAADVLDERHGPAAIQAWFQDMSPRLGDVPPARAIRDDPHGAGPAVLEAAHAHAV